MKNWETPEVDTLDVQKTESDMELGCFNFGGVHGDDKKGHCKQS